MSVTRRPWGHIEELPSGQIRATHWANKRRVRKTFDRVDDADDWLASERFGIKAGTFVDPLDGTITLKNYFEHEFLPGRDHRPKTRDTYERLFLNWLEPFATVSLSEIRPADVRKWLVNARHTARATDATTQPPKAYRLLATLMNAAVAEDRIPKSPCKIVGGGSESAKERPVASIAEVDAMAAAMKDRFRLAILLAAWCQLRRGEILALRRRDIDLLRGEIRIDRSVTFMNDGELIYGPPKTEAGIRKLAIPSNIRGALEAHLDRFVGPDPDDLLVTGVRGSPVRPHVLLNAWKVARSAVGRTDLRMHDLRHSGLTWSASTGATLAELMRRAGHSKPDAAIRYQHATDDRDRALAEALAALGGEAAVFEPTASVIPIRPPAKERGQAT